MAASVPFALLATVQLLAVVGWAALAAVPLFPGLRSRSAPALVAGAVALAVAEGMTGSELGSDSSTTAGILRAVGAALLALGLLAGPPGARSRPRPRPGQPQGLAALAPLPLALAPGLIAAASLLVGAGLALRRRSAATVLLAAGLALHAASAVLGVLGDHGLAGSVPTADAELVLRGVGAALLLTWAGLLARGSLLAKVTGSIVGALVLASMVVAGVVGSTVATRLGNQQAEQVRGVATSEQADIDALQQGTVVLAQALVQQSGSPATLQAAASGITAINQGRRQFVVTVTPSGAGPKLKVLANQQIGQLALDDLAASDLVRTALATPGSAQLPVELTLQGSPPVFVLGTLATVAAAPTATPLGAVVYGFVVDQNLLAHREASAGFDTTIVDITSGRVAGSSLASPAAAALAADARVRAAVTAPPGTQSVISRISNGAEPTLGIATLSNGTRPTALLVVSASSAQVLGTQRVLLRVLFLSLLGAAVVVALLGLFLGSRIAEPVRRLTDAAERVRRGDLRSTAGAAGRDEVGRLARTFDAMTTSLAQADEDLRASVVQETAVRSRLETVLDSIGDGLVVLDPGGRVESLNPAAEDLLGPGADVTGRPLGELADLPLPAGGEARLRTPAGRSVTVVVASTPLADGSGEVVVLRDTSREAEAERMKTEFLSNVSHELRTPLTPIRGYAQILAGRVLPAEKVSEYASVVLTSSVRMARVVDLLVEVAALDAGRVVPQPEPVALGPFIDARLQAWRARVPDRAGDLRRRVAARLPAAHVDPAWLTKAVDELVDNALKFSAPGTPVTLAALAGDDGPRLEVRDLGAGIPEDRRDALFLDFEQVDGSATRARDGLGLGLPFVRRVADVVGLRLTVVSQEGKGSTFGLELPGVPLSSGAPASTRTRRRPGSLTPTP